ncbi:50S ribosomal protein L15 [Candidatus Uhrbacteria bacterium RIFCSPHIGHO2_01_FULL_63_20]|uniref:Large ribosomal subunit protein uL15 n=1 Tax=Candidatus Uhrbacteria bacterium RIFCSPHIGHO2_01_FULL_63_20 TaxID=1802385 RepID=A0A1F7TMR3_9BACT|nr:MAG: 50S ribosomal protein L15 [Candidatus Uhrbacteria bacterium RIFCSPHIGHO2_01_FULL_63_20]
MSMHSLKPQKGSRRAAKRVGRGLSKGGTYSGRGSKGQRARAGGKSGLKLKGIRTMMLRIPKRRGFKSLKPKPQYVNVADIARSFPDGAKVAPKQLFKKGLIESPTAPVKLLGDGNVNIALTVSGCTVSEGAKAKIEKAGGSVLA